ncbi:hypothetical protein F511_37819 [Dorcoceras hygrometricum]|uniref:Uncharacterized protein n=1 Tax=Dorcoceras hygrometricum TaxID=472368 RepID=A0A2Z7BST6_9LAMI|nr:hypothetical protein F511_37819 [Dorcoceras hygrometricum]
MVANKSSREMRVRYRRSPSHPASINTFLRYSLFGGFSTTDIRDFVSAIALDRSVFREATNFDSVVQRAPLLLLSDRSTQENPLVHMDIDQRPDSPSTSANSSMCFDEDEIAATQFSLPVVSTDLTEAFAQLRASVEQIHFEQIRRKDDADKLRDILLMRIRDLERQFSRRFDEQDRAYRALLNNIRKDIHDQKTLLSLVVLTSQQKLSTQVTAVALDNADIRKEVKELRAILTDLDGLVIESAMVSVNRNCPYYCDQIRYQISPNSTTSKKEDISDAFKQSDFVKQSDIASSQMSLCIHM